MRVVRVEQRLGCQSLLDDAEGRGEYDNRGPATTPAAYHFPDQESAAAVERNEQHQGRQRGQGHIAGRNSATSGAVTKSSSTGAIRDHQPVRAVGAGA